jgi:hypothetical protein
MKLEFPWAWLNTPLPQDVRNSLEAICKPPFLASVSRIFNIGETDLTRSHMYLLRQGADIVDLCWSSLDEDLRRKIAFDTMEFSFLWIDGHAIEDQCAHLIDNNNDGLYPSIYGVYLTQQAVIVVNETRLENILDHGDPADIDQDILDDIFLSLINKPVLKSAHNTLSLQESLKDLHQILIDRFLPSDVDVATPQLTLPT